MLRRSHSLSAPALSVDGNAATPLRLLTLMLKLVHHVSGSPAGVGCGPRGGGVRAPRRYVMLAYDVPAEWLSQACALTPGIESPTVSPLQREGWLAVQAMVLRSEVHRIMDELYELGARAIMVTDIHACRL